MTNSNSPKITEHSSRIHDIYVELHGYEYHHGPSSIEEDDPRIFGRKEIQDKLVTMITGTASKTGAYLVTGYRGMGKTSIVRKAIRTSKFVLDGSQVHYKDKRWFKLPIRLFKVALNLLWWILDEFIHYTALILGVGSKKIIEGTSKAKNRLANSFTLLCTTPLIEVELSLAQDDLTEQDILKMLARQMQSKYFQATRPTASLTAFVGFFVRTVLIILLISAVFVAVSFSGLLEWILPCTWFEALPPFLESMVSWETVLASIAVSFGVYAVARSKMEYLRGKFGFGSHFMILRRLQRLSERMDSEVKTGNDLSGTQISFLGFTKKERTYPIASAKDIQNELKEILDDIAALKWSLLRPRFVFVFDELDKIQPRTKYQVAVEGDEDTIDVDAQGGVHSALATRKRQETIAKILANLKHFFNNAKAKFIFIAGREMYDAALADISDRDSYVGSIFDEVFHVPSFLKEKRKDDPTGFTGMTTRYVCQYLFPQNQESEKEDQSELALDAFYDRCKKSGMDPRLAIKALIVLQNFVSYLNYRSNGTPKKITHLFEEFVIDIPAGKSLKNFLGEDTDGQVSPFPSATPNTNVRKFLRFKYHDQYRIALVSRLFGPFLIAHNRSLKTSSDKILVSAAYLLDHIAKFHDTAFNWRDLEHTPELVSASKTPDIRNFYEGMIDFLSKSYLRTTTSGIFQYKFRSRFALEIMFLSKINELESAAFNFTLDESLVIKRYYKAKLAVIAKEVANEGGDNVGASGQSGMIHNILGNLYYYDQEYSDAAFHYRKSIHHMRKTDVKDLSLHQILVLTKGELKLALAMERQKAFDSAFSRYNLITDRILKFFTYHHANQKVGANAVSANFAIKSIAENLKMFQQPMIARLHLIEKESATGIGYRDIVDSESVYDLIAKTGLGDKETEDILNRAQYHFQVGTVLYFKNGQALVGSSDGIEYIAEALDSLSHLGGPNTMVATSALYEYLITLYALIIRVKPTIISPLNSTLIQEVLDIETEISKNKDKKTSGKAFAEHISKRLKTTGVKQLIADLLSFFHDIEIQLEGNSKIRSLGVRFIETCAETLTRIGDILLPHMHVDVLANTPFQTPIARGSISGISPIAQLAWQAYETAANYHKLAGNPKLEAFNCRKQLALLNEWLSLTRNRKTELIPSQLADEIYEAAEKTISRKLKGLTQAGEYSFRPQVLQTLSQLAPTGTSALAEAPDHLSNAIQGSSGHAESKEALILFWLIIRTLPKSDQRKQISYNQFLSPFSSITGMFERVLELMFQVKLNYDEIEGHRFQMLSADGLSIYKILRNNYHNRPTSGPIYKMDLSQKTLVNEFRDFIVDNIFCMLEATRIMSIFGKGYISRYTAIANAYEMLGDWCVQYVEFIRAFPKGEEPKIKEKLKSKIGSLSIFAEDPLYYYEIATHNLKKAMDLHQSGHTYQTEIRDLIYLEDDLGDQASHFAAALERCRINSGYCQAKIVNLEEITARTEIYSPEAHFSID